MGAPPNSSALGFRLRHLPFLSLLLLIVVAPLERVTPTVTLFSMALTDVEVTLLVTLIVWLCFSLSFRRRPKLESAVKWPGLLLLVSMLFSTWLAADHPGEALRFCGRFAAGLLIYTFVVNQVYSQRRLLALLSAAFISGTAVALFGILEYFRVPPISQWLMAFKETSSWVGGQLRASSTLQYPTITSMFLEITFGLGLGLLLYALFRNRIRLSALIFLGLAVTAQGILFTQTRAGLATLALQLLLVLGLYGVRRGKDRGFHTLLALTALVAGLTALMIISNPMYRLRLTTSGSEGWYGADFRASVPLQWAPGEFQQVPITVTNTGLVPWIPSGESPFHLSYHWLDAEQELILVWEGLRTGLPQPVGPGEQVTLQARVLAPPKAGQYRLAWDMVQENRLWFSDEERLEAFASVLVDGPPSQGELEVMAIPHPRFRVTRFELWSTAVRMLFSHPLLGVGPDNFRFSYGDYLDLEEWDHTLHSNHMYLEFFAGSGVPGGIFFLWLCLRVLAQLKSARVKTGETHDALWMSMAAGCLAIWAHGVMDYFLVFTPTYILIWTTWGATEALTSTDHADSL